MKTLYFIPIVFCLPFLMHGQSVLDAFNDAVIAKGEQWIARGAADSASEYAQSLLQNRKLNPSSKGQAYYVAGRAGFVSGDAETAIPFFQKSLALSRKHHLEPLQLRSLLSLCAAYGDHARDLDSALYFLKPARQLAEKLKDTIRLAEYYIYSSNILYLSEDYKSAVEYNYFCEVLLKNTNYDHEKAKNCCGLANNLMEIYINKEQKEDLENAQKYFENAIAIFKRLGRRTEEAHARNSLAGSLLYAEDLTKAANEVRQSIELGESLKDTSILLNGYYTLSTLYEMNGHAGNAKESLLKLLDFLEKKGNASDFAFMKAQFGNSDSRVSKALINSKIGIFSKQIENQRLERERLVLSFVAIIVALLALALFAFLRQRNKLHHKELENLLQTQEIQYMKARQEGEEDGRHRIARQIHDGVGGLLVSAKWNLESALEELPPKETKVAARLNENLRLQEHSYKELRRVVYALEQEDTAWWDDLRNFYQGLTEHRNTKIRFFTYNLDKKVRGEIGREARFIVQEIVTNALKHANATEINVQINQIGDTLGIIIEDNGDGFDPAKVLKGVGLRSIEERCAKLGGSIIFETEKGHGTTVFVDLPIDHQNMLKENPLLYAGSN